MTKPAVVRFAPSPTGPPHLGNLRTALFDWLLAHATGGRFILRIDDTDQTRYNASAEQAMLDALQWVGLNWDEGPDIGGPHVPYRQSERLQLYRDAAERLVELGHAYRPADEPEIIRLKTPDSGKIVVRDVLRGDITFDAEEVPQNPVLLKSDGFPTYHLATVIDDQAMGVTHILRGEEWIPSTPMHLQMFEALGYQPPVFIHLSLVTDKEGKKIKKRDPSFEVNTYREAGFLPEAVINYLAFLGWHPGTEEEFFSKDDLVQRFSIERLSKSPAAFDDAKLRWFNQQHIARLDLADLVERVMPRIEATYPAIKDHSPEWKTQLVSAVREELTTLNDTVHAVRFAFEFGDFTVEAQEALHSEQAQPVISAFLEAVRTFDSLDAEGSGNLLKELRNQFKKSHGWGGKAVMFPLRAALTGTVTGPHLSDVAALLGKEESLRRIHAALAIM
jgi:glutamyl-tRNA synthetase